MDLAQRGVVAEQVSSKQMIVFSDQKYYGPENRYHLNNIIKALWNDRSPIERDTIYGTWTRGYEYSPDLSKADIALLTYTWNYYVDRGIEQQAYAEIENASRHGKKTVVFCGGDAPANLSHPNIILCEAAGYRSSQELAYHSGMPFFLRDYLSKYCEGEHQPRQWSPVPVIGFCGQADASPLRTIFRSIRLRVRQARYHAGRLKWQPAPFETASFRRRVLAQFEGSQLVRTNYLLREKYHAGNDREKDDHSPQKLAFVNNILGSDYTVCMRGGGNFSIRFYETLALGRIPIFIDTDCLLPFHERIPYRELFPWIEMKDLPRAAEIVADFHARHSGDEFVELQRSCRKLWEEHFTPNGFYRDLREKLEDYA
ncbi:MAG: exostosin family protein [Anaerolineaceae bacterium]